jgi:hypothetical protein
MLPENDPQEWDALLHIPSEELRFLTGGAHSLADLREEHHIK